MCRFLNAVLLCVSASALGGCVTSQPGHEKTARQKPAESQEKPRQWDWACGIPRSVQRADLVPATIASQALANLLPAADRGDIQLASMFTDSTNLQITQVAGKPVQNYENLHEAAQRAAESKELIEITVRDGAALAEPATSKFEVDPATLVAITQRAAPDHHLLRTTEDGNPWIVLRDGDARCQITARVERDVGLVQVVLSLGVARGGTAAQLPTEVRASCNDHPLRCLTVGDALECLYDPSPRRALSHPEDEPAKSAQCSFAAISQLDDYQVPYNYRRLQDETKQTTGLPALAIVPGTFYPGSPLLGDARALTAFLLQPQLCQPGEADKLGWVIFSGECLKHGGTLDLVIDLGNGPRHVSFLVPKS